MNEPTPTTTPTRHEHTSAPACGGCHCGWCAVRCPLCGYICDACLVAVREVCRADGRATAALPEYVPSAADMPDDCHDYCVNDGIDSMYYPYRWVRGSAFYTCDRGHDWTCQWGHGHSGTAPEFKGTPAWRAATEPATDVTPQEIENWIGGRA